MLKPTYVEFTAPVRLAACGFSHTLVSTADGLTYSFGCATSFVLYVTLTMCGRSGQYGQLGHGRTGHELAPRVITTLEEMRIEKLACGWNHSAAVTGTLVPIILTVAKVTCLSC